MAEPGALDYFYGTEAEQYTFYRIPKVLFTDPGFRRITADAKIGRSNGRDVLRP